MKKSLLAVLCGVILGAALIFGACGNSSAKTTAASDPQSILEAYLAEDTNQKAFESVNESMESLGITMTVYADGSSIVYDYTYSNIPSTTAGIADTLLSSMEDQEDTFASAVAQVESEVGLDGVSMVYNYIGSDGEVIISQTYTSDGLVE